jgi:hypothetical protein
MKLFLLCFVTFLYINVTAQVPDLYFQNASITQNIHGNPISKGDTVQMIVNYRGNGSTTRTIYFDFQYNYKLFSIIDVSAGNSALPQGGTTSFTNYFYPGYTYLRNAQNFTRNGTQNYTYCNYSYNTNSPNAIQRIYVTVGSASNLLDGYFLKVNLKVNNVAAGSAYDSLYMDFATTWDKGGANLPTNLADPRSTWVQLAAGQNELVKGSLYVVNSAQPKLFFIDSATNALKATVYPDINGNFSLASELSANTTYKVQVAIDSLKTKAQSAITISDAAAVLGEFGSQNLDGTFNNSNIMTGAGYLAADINYNKKLDGADPYLLLSHVAGVDSLTPSLYLMPRTEFNALSTTNWNAKSYTDYVYFKTGQVSQPLVLNYLIAGDVNRSHSSQVVDAGNNIKSFSFVNTPIQTKSPVNVNLANVVAQNDYISIPFNISTDSKVCGLQFELLFDETKLMVDTVSANTDASWLNFFKIDGGKLKFGGIDKTLSNPVSGTPYIVRLKAINGGANISTLVTVTDNMDASDNKGNQLGVNLNSQSIRILGINNFK